MTMEKKSQGMEGTKNPQFERSFSDLAFAYLKDQAPKLLDHMVGFQILDKNDDDTKAVGVFGFKVGEQWLMAPVFFLNGELKGKELLYLTKQDSFIPLQENWVNYLVSRKPSVFGEATPYTETELGVRTPDFRPYSDSPLRGWGKTAAVDYDPSTEDERYGYWFQGQRFDVSPILKCFARSVNDARFKAAAARLDLAAALPHMGSKATKLLVDQIMAQPELGQALGEFYSGRDLMPKTAGDCTATKIGPPSDVELRARAMDRDLFRYTVKKLARARSLALTGTDRVVAGLLTKLGVHSIPHLRTVLPAVLAEPEVSTAVKKACGQESRLFVLTRAAAMDDPRDDLSDDERQELMTDGILVRDKRAADERSKAYDVDTEKMMFNPDESGLYEMPDSNGTTHKVLVLMSPATVGSGTAKITIVAAPDSRSWDAFDTKSIFVSKQLADDWTQFYDGLPSVKAMVVGKTYIAVGPDRTGTVVFNVADVSDDDVYVHVPYVSASRVSTPYYGPSSTVNHDFPTQSIAGASEYLGSVTGADRIELWKREVRHIVLTDKINALRSIGNTLMVPSGFKAVELENHDNLGFVPATLTDVEMFMLKRAGLDPLRVWSHGLGYQLSDASGSTSCNRTEALVTLVRSCGCTKDAAMMMLNRADDSGEQTYLIKRAYGYGGVSGELQPGPSAPPTSVLDNISGYDSELGAVTQEPQSASTPVDLPMAEGQAIRDRDPKLDHRVIGAAIQASRSGQKEVMDTGVMGSLVKAMDTDSIVDKYLEDLIVGEDRIGRILFMFYWHNDKFSDRYGDHEMKELEDTLRNTFTGVGDLILFLKKKEIAPDMALLGSDVDLGRLSNSD